MVRVGVIVNPDAGLGGRLGLKGSDGLAEKARNAGAEDRAGPRAKKTLSLLSEHLKAHEVRLLMSRGRMGTEWLDPSLEVDFSVVHETFGETSKQNTTDLVSVLVRNDVELILYAGGDGTTRDIVKALDQNSAANTPVVGIPCGLRCTLVVLQARLKVLRRWSKVG